MRALDHRFPGQGRSQGGGAERVCASLGFSGTRGPMAREDQDSGGDNRNQWRSHGFRTCTDRFTESQTPVFTLGTVLWPSARVDFTSLI